MVQTAQVPRALPWGQACREGGEAAYASLMRALQLLQALPTKYVPDAMHTKDATNPSRLPGAPGALVTAPLSKAALHLAGYAYPGHTEILQAFAAQAAQAPVPVRMMLANDELRVVLVSVHVALREAIARLSVAGVLETLEIAHTSLSAMLGRAPRLAVAGLNPHAGEDGLFGREELDLIAPAIAQAQARGILASGPYPPDTVFARARLSRHDHTHNQPGTAFDAVIAMYHDQGLIPVKYLGIEHGVNVTLGLPFVRTSPDHGTAFDIAGQGRSDARSLLAAIRMARQLARTQTHTHTHTSMLASQAGVQP